jgi:ketosteroid isomerase-like protein
MSQENVEVARAIYERWREGDFRTSLDAIDPLVLFVHQPPLPESGTYVGIDELVAFMRNWLESFSHFAIEAEDITDAGGDTVVATVHQRGVGSGSGAETDLRYFQVWSFRGGNVIRLENHRGRAQALEAAGLRE